MNSKKIIIYITVFNLFWSIFNFFYTFEGYLNTLFGGKLRIIVFLINIFVYSLILTKNKCFINKKNIQPVIFILFTYTINYLFAGIIGNSFPSGGYFINIVQLSIFLVLNDYIKLQIFNLFLRIFCLWMSIALLEYIIIILSGYGIHISSYIRYNNTYTQILNQFLFNFVNIGNGFPRFQSLCEEPGVVGDVCFLLLYLTCEMRNKLYYWLVWIFGIFSFSLGFYFLSITYIFSRNFKLKYVIIGVLGLYITYLSFPEFFDTLIINRIDGRSIEEIDNRSSDALNSALIDSINDGSIFWGHGATLPSMSGDNSGGKPWIYKYGIIWTFFILSSIYVLFRNEAKRFKLKRWTFFVLIAGFLLAFYKSPVLELYYFMCLFMIIPLIQFYSKNNTSK